MMLEFYNELGVTLEIVSCTVVVIKIHLCTHSFNSLWNNTFENYVVFSMSMHNINENEYKISMDFLNFLILGVCHIGVCFKFNLVFYI